MSAFVPEGPYDGFLTLLRHHLRAHFHRLGWRLLVLYGSGLLLANGVILLFIFSFGEALAIRQVMLLHAMALAIIALFVVPPRPGAYAVDQAATESFFLTTGWRVEEKFHAWLLTGWLTVFYLWMVMGGSIVAYAFSSPTDLVAVVANPQGFIKLAGLPLDKLGIGWGGSLLLHYPVPTSLLYLAGGWLGALVMATVFFLLGSATHLLLSRYPVIRFGLDLAYALIIFFFLTIFIAGSRVGYFTASVEGGGMEELSLVPDVLITLFPFLLVPALPRARPILRRLVKGLALAYPVVIAVLMVLTIVALVSLGEELSEANYLLALPLLVAMLGMLLSPFELMLSLSFPSGLYQLALFRVHYLSNPLSPPKEGWLVNLPVWPELASLVGTVVIAYALYLIVSQAYRNLAYGLSPWD